MPHYTFVTLLEGVSALRRKGLNHRNYTFADAAERANQRFILALLVCAISVSACAQEFTPDQVVFPIRDFKPEIKLLALAVKFGTGFCLDPNCRFVGTNYHVAKVLGKHIRIKGVSSAQLYLDSNPSEVGAQDVRLAGGASLKYLLAHDLAIYEMKHPLKGFHGIGLEIDNLEKGIDAEIYAYPLDWNPRRKLVCWRSKFLGPTQQGLLAFSNEEGRVRGGASGGIVVDSKTHKIVGILSALADEDHVVLAVPIEELVNFVARTQPYLQETLFPKTVFVSPVAADLYAPYPWPRIESLSRRLVEPPEILRLRRAAQHLAESMKNFTATETFAWGRDNREPEAVDAYDTLIVDGQQRWRRPGTNKFYDSAPFPNLHASIVPGEQWSEFPKMVGTDYNLKIRQAPDALVGGQTVRVFQYAANVEDRICSFESV